MGPPGAACGLPARVDTPLAPSTALLQRNGVRGAAQRAGPRAHAPNPEPPGPPPHPWHAAATLSATAASPCRSRGPLRELAACRSILRVLPPPPGNVVDTPIDDRQQEGCDGRPGGVSRVTRWHPKNAPLAPPGHAGGAAKLDEAICKPSRATQAALRLCGDGLGGMRCGGQWAPPCSQTHAMQVPCSPARHMCSLHKLQESLEEHAHAGWHALVALQLHATSQLAAVMLLAASASGRAGTMDSCTSAARSLAAPSAPARTL